MMDFRSLIAKGDAVVFDTLGDAGNIDGRSVLGMFYAPWLQPNLGRLKTGVTEPHYTVRDADAVGVSKNSRVNITGYGDYEVVALEPNGTGITTLVLRRS